MSEYQYYEFLAIDRPLTDEQQARVRSLSTRARITATSFVNEYQWGDFRGRPDQLMEYCYDAHLHVTNWGTHHIMFRLPIELLDFEVVEQYCVGDLANAWTTDEFIILDFLSEDDSEDFDTDPEPLLGTIVGVRAELAAGDLRPLYLGWLASYGLWERDDDAFDRAADDELEPPVPPGLGALSAAQRAFADFLRIDKDLLETAAETSPQLASAGTSDELAAWIKRLPVAAKNRMLVRVAQGDGNRVRMELSRRFHDENGLPAENPEPRTVADLLDAADRRRSTRTNRLAAERAARAAQLERDRAIAYQRRLDDLAHDPEAAWARVQDLIETRKPAAYDSASALLVELRDLADREGTQQTFRARIATLQRDYARRPALLERLSRVDI